MFLQGTKAETEEQCAQVGDGSSILRMPAGGSGESFGGNLGSRDRDRLDQYFTSVRELDSGCKCPGNGKGDREKRAGAARSGRPKGLMDKSEC